MKVLVKESHTKEEYDQNLESAMRIFKRRVNRDGTLQELKKKNFYVKPGVKKRLKHEEAMKERRLALRKVEKYSTNKKPQWALEF